MDYSRPCASVHAILQARILEWITMPSPRGSSWPRDRSCILSCIAGEFFTSVPPGKPVNQPYLTNTCLKEAHVKSGVLSYYFFSLRGSPSNWWNIAEHLSCTETPGPGIPHDLSGRQEEQSSSFPRPALPHAPPCQLLSVVCTYRVPRQMWGRTGSHQGGAGRSTAGTAGRGLCQEPPPRGDCVPACRTLQPCFSAVTPGFHEPPLPTRCVSLISVCFSGPWPLCRPKLQVLSSSFVLISALSWPPEPAVITTQAQKEGAVHVVNWVVKKKRGCSYFFFKKASNLFNLHWSTIWPNRLIGSDGQPDRIG